VKCCLCCWRSKWRRGLVVGRLAQSIEYTSSKTFRKKESEQGNQACVTFVCVYEPSVTCTMAFEKIDKALNGTRMKRCCCWSVFVKRSVEDESQLRWSN
jgi:hypothetical protein